MSRSGPEAPYRPETEAEPAEQRHSDDRDARDRELLDYLIEVTWAACIRRLRNERDEGE
jgi:hypothetical protein